MWLVYSYKFGELLNAFVWGFRVIFWFNLDMHNMALWLTLAPPSTDAWLKIQQKFVQVLILLYINTQVIAVSVQAHMVKKCIPSRRCHNSLKTKTNKSAIIKDVWQERLSMSPLLCTSLFWSFPKTQSFLLADHMVRSLNVVYLHNLPITTRVYIFLVYRTLVLFKFRHLNNKRYVAFIICRTVAIF